MKLGVAFAWHVHPWEDLLALVQRSEELGFAAAFVDGDVSMLASNSERDVLDGWTVTTALLASRERPTVPILALTPVDATARRLSLAWGLHCVVGPPVDRFKMAVVGAIRTARAEGFAGDDDNIIITAGVPFNVPGSTNILRVAPMDERMIFEGGGD